jgi:hypothetical protein
MEYCYNHPETEALSKCRGCGKFFCESCLTEGNNYYYCSNRACQALLEGDSSQEKLPTDIYCPNCNEEIELTEEESKSRKFHCPECETFIDYTTDPPGIYPPKKFVHLLSSFNNADISVMKSILNDAEIDYYFTGENFLLVDPLIQPAELYVLESNADEAQELLKDLDLKFFGVSDGKQD